MIPVSRMAEEIVFEKVDDGNFDEFFSLVEKLAEYEKQNQLDKQVKLRLKQDALSEKPRFEAYLTKLNNRYIGYFIFFMTYSSYLALPTLYLEDIFVLEELRGKGIGQKMFQFCIQQAKEKAPKKGAFSFAVDLRRKTLNSLKTYLFEFWNVFNIRK